jgi:hypothetical protein
MKTNLASRTIAMRAPTDHSRTYNDIVLPLYALLGPILACP